MMSILTIPVANGVLPKPRGGKVNGVFLDRYSAAVLEALGAGGVVLLCPYSSDTGSLYPVGTSCRLEKLWFDDVMVGGFQRMTALFATVRGGERIKAKGFELRRGKYLMCVDPEPIDLERLREQGYPTIEGAGWKPMGGSTEPKGDGDIPVTVFGIDLETGGRVGILANLGGILDAESAHTVEHAIIRSLDQYGLCTPKTLAASLEKETADLKNSLAVGFSRRMPEIFGVTESGMCGNPLTNLAHFYIGEELRDALDKGDDLWRSIEVARRKTLSRLTEELEITTQAGLRILQGLKKGMAHDDTKLRRKQLEAVLARFPSSPWTG